MRFYWTRYWFALVLFILLPGIDGKINEQSEFSLGSLKEIEKSEFSLKQVGKIISIHVHELQLENSC